MRAFGPALFVVLASVAAPAAAQWSNSGGNAGRNGLTDQLGPDAAETIWTGAPTSVIAWQPVIEGRRVYVVRQTGFPPEPASNRSPIFCLDLDTGAQIFRIDLPFTTGDWTTWIAGVKDGRLYAARSGNGASSTGPLRCYNAQTGAFLWSSAATINAGFYDGVVFAPDGDPVVADFTHITRINAQNGATVWRVPRLCSVSGNCGGAIGANTVYIADAVPGGHRIKAFDLGTGAFRYESPLMPGFTLQNSPMVAPNGTVYLPRTQNNAQTDFLYAFDDTGSALTQRWAVPTQWTTSTELAVGPDGSVYHLAPGRLLTRLDPATGQTIDQSATPIPFDGSGLTPRLAADREGRIYLTNGAFANGRLMAFHPDTTPMWDVPFPNVNIGGPSFGPDGTLGVAGTGSNMRAYRTNPCLADLAAPFGTLNFFDLAAYLALYNASDPAADLAAPFGELNFFDIAAYLAAFNAGCP
jgi:hypothetical protein